MLVKVSLYRLVHFSNTTSSSIRGQVDATHVNSVTHSTYSSDPTNKIVSCHKKETLASSYKIRFTANGTYNRQNLNLLADEMFRWTVSKKNN